MSGYQLSGRIVPMPVTRGPAGLSSARGGRGGGFGRGIGTAWRYIVRMLEARRSRLALADLDDHELQDLGVSRAQARFEASRPIWDVRS